MDTRTLRLAIGRRTIPALALILLAVPLGAATGAAEPQAEQRVAATSAGATVRLDARRLRGGEVPANFVGFSVEWSLIERYMGPAARPAFAKLLGNLGTGVLRIGGSSQDLVPFEPGSPDSNRVITPTDLQAIRSTLELANSRDRSTQPRPSWGAVLGTAMAPPRDTRPFVSPEHARRFATEGVAPVFAGGASRLVAGIELGNEPDLSYGQDGLEGYVADLATYAAPGVTGPWPVIAPNTSEDILPWQSIHERTVPTRYFWDWPRILDTAGAQMRARAGAFGGYASDHFYPLARTCVDKPYRCPSIPALLSDEHLASLDYQVDVHAREAAKHGLGYRLEETNTAAGRGADGVSNVAASATYALDMLFHAACPQPPHTPGANADCRTGAIGVNLHNAEVRAFFEPQEGNAYYNAVNYDPTPAMGAPSAAPEYYALLLFSRFAQGGSGLRPVDVGGDQAVKAWRVEGDGSQRRLFLVNKADHPVTVQVEAPASTARVSRMTPYDPSGAGRGLDAPQVRIDGRQVSADGSWPGFHPTLEGVHGGRLPVTLAAGEASVITVH